MKTIWRFWTLLVLVLTLFMLGITPAAAQDSEQYLPFVGGNSSVEPAALEQSAAEEPPAPAPDIVPAVVRHEPGRPPKVKDLDVRMAAGEIEDPLAGNSTLVFWDKIAMVLQGTGATFVHRTFDVDANLGVPVAKERVSGLAVNGGGNMEIGTGYFTGDSGWMDTVTAWEYPAGKISLYV